MCTPLLKPDLILIVADAIYAASSIPFIEASIRFCGAGANTDDVRLLRSHFIFLLKGTSYMASFVLCDTTSVNAADQSVEMHSDQLSCPTAICWHRIQAILWQPESSPTVLCLSDLQLE